MSPTGREVQSASSSQNDARLRRLRTAIEEDRPIDGIHNPRVADLNENDGECPRYLACSSEGHCDSSFRDNPDFFSGEAAEVSKWLAASYEEGWAGRWVLDLDTGEQIGWKTTVDLGVDHGADGK